MEGGRLLLRYMCVTTLGIVFDNLESNDLEYTLRLRHEVGGRNTWRTNEVAGEVQSPGPRVSEK